MGKKTMVIGATTNQGRYAFFAVKELLYHGHDVIPIGIKKGNIFGMQIINGLPQIQDIHTITLYVGPKNQENYIDYIFELNPKRIIFNPGSENDKLIKQALLNDIEVIIDCTLMMLSNGEY
ncbi:CoA-binding protein [Bacteroidota bacterium]